MRLFAIFLAGIFAEPIIRDIEEGLPTAPDGCTINCMLSIEEEINSCEAFEGQEEFKCVTDAMRGFFRCVSACIPETLGKR